MTRADAAAGMLPRLRQRLRRRGSRELTLAAAQGGMDVTAFTRPFWPLTPGEVHYFFHFMQGSIMVPAVRRALRRAWGLCERHAWGALAVELCYRRSFLHGQAILYSDLVARAHTALHPRGPLQERRIRYRLAPRGPCFVCEFALERTRGDLAPEAIVARGRDVRGLRRFATRTAPHWQHAVCGVCAGDDDAPNRCRRHLLAELRAGRPAAMIDPQRAMLQALCVALDAYRRSFAWDTHLTAGPRERAALVTAIGWLSGWRPLLVLLKDVR